MKKSFIAVGVASLLGLASVTQAADFNWYGDIRTGVIKDIEGNWDIGAAGLDGNIGSYGVWSRIGVKATTDLGNGLSAGGQVEIGVGGGDFNLRYHNVWVGGGWGKLTIGQRFNLYHTAANWDQASMLGGQVRNNYRTASRLEGISYASNLEGPFSFNIMALGNDGEGKKGVDGWIATAHYDFGVATVNLGHNKDSRDAITYDSNTVISVNGSVDNFSYFVAHEQSKDASLPKASVTGLFLRYGITASDSVYLEYEKEKDGYSRKNTVFGYSHSLGNGVVFVAEYSDSTNTYVDGKLLNLVIKAGF